MWGTIEGVSGDKAVGSNASRQTAGVEPMHSRASTDSVETAADFFGTMPGPNAVRVLPDATLALLLRIVGALWFIGGGSAAVATSRESQIREPTGVLVTALVAVSIGCLTLVFARWTPDTVRRIFPVAVYAQLIAAVVVITIGLYFAGPRYAIGGAFYIEAPIFAFYLLPRRLAVLFLVLPGVGWAMLLAGPGYASPGFIWLGGMGVLVALGGGVGGFMARADRLAASEREARLALAEMNRTLEQRVAEQVEELGRLGRLRRFLSPAVADAVLSSDREHLLAPHRREIAVFFCDLRGFTKFAASAQPEEVDSVLTAYFELLGDLVTRYEATVGGFTGDGLMAFLNDPLPVHDPALRAVSMAIALRAPMDRLLGGWRRQGFDLGFGVGIALGYANIGTIGFEGRRDYTALGPVVNLAARLCAEAGSGDILIDQRAYAACDDRVTVAQGRSVVLKGYHDPVVTYPVTSVMSDSEHGAQAAEAKRS